MQCSQCHAETPRDAEFCPTCGAKLTLLCGKCGTANAPDHNFCKKCGHALRAVHANDSPGTRFRSPQSYTPRHLAEKILVSKSAVEGERKQVTVLFVDVSGFTSLSERLDPEDVHGFMTRIFDLMLAEVHRYEGTVNQFLGDGIMALFGAPIAHEDHGQRALHAALGIRAALASHRDELQRAQNITFEVRQGLNTGLVVVGSIGSDLRMDYTAVGDTTNVAARLQQQADPGRIVISEATQRLVAGYFYTRPLGELALKGKAQPVRAWEVISARLPRGRLEVETERGLTPFVGRERELRQLADCFDKAKSGHGQVVLLVGEPGIGKSRLLFEFRRRLGEEATWVEGRSMSFGSTIAFHPLIDLLRRTFRIEEGDPEEAILAKIERAVLRLGSDLGPILPWLRYLLSVDPGDPAVPSLDPQLRRAEIFDAIRGLLLRAAEVRPQVVVFEDVHWMDRATEEYVALMADGIAASRVVMVLTYRPGYAQPFGERSYYTRIALTSLSSEDSVQMARAVLATDRLPNALQALITRKAEGNPFFVEEVVKSLQEVGAIRLVGDEYVLAKRLDEIFVPDTIQDVIMARIDRLEEPSKKALQVASVIGREFTRRLLDRIADVRGRAEDLLRELKAVELIYEKSLFPELAYMFKHALTHDVAYNSLLLQRRRDLHRIIAGAIEELYAERLAEHYEILAHHFSCAEDWSKALAYLLKAAEKATRAFANREAISLYDRALEASGHLGPAVGLDTLMVIHRAKLGLHALLSDFRAARAEGTRLLELARQAGDQTTESEALAALGLWSLWAHDFEPALSYSCEAMTIAGGAGAQSALAEAHLATGWTHTVCGRLAEGQAHLEQAIAISRAAGDAFHQSLALSIAGQHETWADSPDTALQLQGEALKLARDHNLVLPLLAALFGHGLSSTTRGNYEHGRQLFQQGLTLSERVGDEVWHHRFLNCLGWLHIELSDLDMAVELNRRSAEGAKKRGDPETRANAEINLGDIFVAQGDLTLAHELLDSVHRLVNDPAVSEWQKWRYSTHLFASLGELWFARGDLDRARTFSEQCLEIATRTNAQKYLARAWRLAGQIAQAQRNPADAERALHEALTAARKISNPTQLWRTYFALGRFRQDSGQPDMAREAYGAAWAVLEHIRHGLRDERLLTNFVRAPMFWEIYQTTQAAP
jgi:predicted ATPase/class 3 adenylate cyclase